MNIKITLFKNQHDEVEQFREQTFKEGNDSLHHDKFNLNNFNGKIWLCYINDEIASISAAEKSHYTGDPDVAVRICRYHILKRFRHSHCGFRMLEHQIKWFKQSEYKILYWTHDIHNKSLNALYQHKRRMLDPEAKQWFEASWYKEIKLDTRLLFRVSSKSDFLQYVYYLNNDNYVWQPKSNMVWFNHNGEINIPNRVILDGSN